MTTTSPSIPPRSSTRTTTSSDLRSEPSPRAIGTAAGVDRAFAVTWTLPARPPARRRAGCSSVTRRAIAAADATKACWLNPS